MLKKYIKTILSILIAILIGIFIYKNRSIFQEIEKIEFTYIIPIISTIIAGLYLNGATIKILAKPFKINLKEHFKLSIATSFLNLITPFRGGAAARAVYMKKKHNLKYSDFIASLLGNYIIVFLTASILAIFIQLYLYTQENILNISIFLVFLAIFIATVFSILFKPKFKKPNAITSKINKVIEGWTLILKHPKIIPKLTALTLLNLFVAAIGIYLTFTALNIETTATKALYLSVMSALGILINITPGSLGITEGLYFLSANTLGINPTLSLLIALILRTINSITLLVLGPIANWMLLNKHHENKP